MKKKILIGGGVLVLTLLVAGIFVVQRKAKAPVRRAQDQVQQQANDGQQSQPSLDNELVWYEIPELGIEFKVTPDEKDDLKYEVKKYKDGIAVSLYSQSVIDFLGKNYCFAKDGTNTCTTGSLSRISIKQNEINRNNGNMFCRTDSSDRIIITTIGEDIICLVKPQDDPIGEKHFLYEDFIKDKKFGTYFNTVQNLQL